MKLKLFLLWTCSALNLIALELAAQGAEEQFGNNRLQYREFDWQFVSSENFDLHYYGEQLQIAKEAVNYLESEFEDMTGLLGSVPYEKTRIFLYESITDLQQSNTDLNHVRFKPGGETKFIKPRIEIAHPGSLEELKEQLKLKVADWMVQEMMFGGTIKDVFKSAVLLNLPSWFTDGVSHYVAKGWSIEMDDYIHQIIKSGKVKKAFRFTGHEGALVGQSVWNFIVEKYGRSSISSLLNYARLIRNEENAIQATLGVSIRQFRAEWQEFYSSDLSTIESHYTLPPDSVRITRVKGRSTVNYTTVKLSANGRYLAYAENDLGKYTVYVKVIESGKEQKILSGGLKVIGQDWDYRLPLLGWVDTTTMAVIGKKRGEYLLSLYDIESQTKVSRYLPKFSNIQSFSVSSNGRLMVVSGSTDGKNDLYLLSTRQDRMRRLTRDDFDDLDPVFVPGSGVIIFSTNRAADTLASGNIPLQELSRRFSLYSYNLDQPDSAVQRLTNTLSRDIKPMALSASEVLYLSDQRGIINFFNYNKKTGIYKQLTNYSSSVQEFDYNPFTKQLVLVLNNHLQDQIFLYNGFVFRQMFTPQTGRINTQQLKKAAERFQSKTTPDEMSIKDLINQRLKGQQDSTLREDPNLQNEEQVSITIPPDSLPDETINTSDYVFEDETEIPDRTAQPSPSNPTITTDDYQFDNTQQRKNPSDSFLERFKLARKANKVEGPFNYRPQFSYDNLVTTFAIDPFRGLMQRLELQLNDELENYRLYGGLQFRLIQIKSGDVFVEFQYLPRLIDYSVRFDRKVYFRNSTDTETDRDYEEKYSYQKLEFGASLPISVRTRVSIKPFVSFTRFIDKGYTIPSTGVPEFRDPQTQFYSGAKAEIVYDNSVTTGLNISEGTKAKIKFIQYVALGNTSKNFSHVSVDIRHYQKLYKQITLAFRGLGGAFLGASPKHYLLGGVDTWGARNFNYTGYNNPLVSGSKIYNEQFLFTEFATNLRGFQYATLYGNKALLGNVELRIPLIRTLRSGPITSNFFKNLQFIGFFDIGTAWSGGLPFGENTSVRKRIVPEGDNRKNAFRVVINEFSNPWLYSYGCGLRTVVLGQFLWLNYAWPVENYQNKKPVLSAGIGLDF